MTENNTPAEHDDARLDALQAAFDRVNSYDEGATPEQVRAELDGAIDQTGVEVSEETRQKLADHIAEGGGREDVATLL